MKNLILTIFFIIQAVILTAQNSEYKIAENDGKLYYNRHLPVYLWISRSPDSNDADVLMTSHKTKAYVNPMYFDSDGYNTFQTAHASDSIGKHNGYAIFKVYVDGYAPQMNVFFSGTRHYSNGKYYYSKGLEIKITAKDYNSGVDKIYYSIDNQEFKIYSKPLSFNEVGDYVLKVYAVDRTGNSTKIKTYKFSVK